MDTYDNTDLGIKAENLGLLYVVATPIGHLGDLTRRAEDVLKQVQIIAAEDTRRAARLLAHLDHQAPSLISLHDHNEQARTDQIIERLLAGDDVALVSDAGTPLINDPGFHLVRSAHEAGVRCVPVPGCSSVITALSVCPLPCQTFTYLGFIPAKEKAREGFLQDALRHSTALVMFEVPHRIGHTLQALEKLTQRRVMLGRELTKQFETLYVGTAGQVSHALGEHPKGEMVMVIEATDEAAVDHEPVRVLEALLDEMSPSAAARVAANILGTKRQEMYSLAQTIGNTEGNKRRKR
ncbi:MAG: 16S rRNA (cytidine(1402)-2'-O)-methyltransferase [Pseudomonadota bacterium]